MKNSETGALHIGLIIGILVIGALFFVISTISEKGRDNDAQIASLNHRVTVLESKIDTLEKALVIKAQ